MNFIKTTEQDSKYNHLEKMTVSELLTNINTEDKTVPLAVEQALPQIESLTTQIVKKLGSIRGKEMCEVRLDACFKHSGGRCTWPTVWVGGFQHSGGRCTWPTV